MVSIPGSQTSKTDSETGSQLNQRCVEGNLLAQVVCDKDRHDETVNTNNTSHDDGNNVYEVGLG